MLSYAASVSLSFFRNHTCSKYTQFVPTQISLLFPSSSSDLSLPLISTYFRVSPIGSQISVVTPHVVPAGFPDTPFHLCNMPLPWHCRHLHLPSTMPAGLPLSQGTAVPTYTTPPTTNSPDAVRIQCYLSSLSKLII